VAHLWAPVRGATPDPPVDGRAAHRQPTQPAASEGAAHEPSHRLGPTARWLASANLPGWNPLVDHGPVPLHTARSIGRWLWPTLALTGFLTVTGFVLRHDDPAPGLSRRGLLTITLAALVVVLLTVHRTAGPGPLTRALVEYAVVFLLAALIATTGINLDPPPAGAKQASTTHDQRPALIKTIDSFGDWLSQWRTWARTETNRRAHASPPTPTAPALPSTTRSSL